MAYTNIWNESFPPDTQAAKLLGQDIRSLETNIRERLGTYYSGPLANRLDPEALWAGIMYFATDTSQIFRWNGLTWDDVTSDFIPAAAMVFFEKQWVFLGMSTGQTASFAVWRTPFNCRLTKFQGLCQSVGNATVEVFKNGVSLNTLNLDPQDVWHEVDMSENFAVGDTLYFGVPDVALSPPAITVQANFVRS
jgi:hypothetical protein